MSNTNFTDQLNDRIWITSRCRIAAERRYRHYDTIAHLTLSTISTISVIIGVIAIAYPQDNPSVILAVSLSVSILALSLIVFGFRFGETAVLHRECYLRLDKIRLTKLNEEELNREYQDILSSYPNHSNYDFQSLIIERKLFHKENLSNSLGKTINLEWYAYVYHFLVFVVLWLFPIVAFIGGALLIYNQMH